MALVIGESCKELSSPWRPRRSKAEARQKCRRKRVPELARKKHRMAMAGSLVRRRPVRVLSAYDHDEIGVASLRFQRMKTLVEVSAVEIDAACRRLTELRFDFVTREVHDLRALSETPVEWLLQFDLLMGGFPCQDVSVANRRRQGLRSDRSSLFYVFAGLAATLRVAGKHFVFECTDFKKVLPNDVREMSDGFGVRPVVLCASWVSAGYRR